jgi:hypothetical protein
MSELDFSDTFRAKLPEAHNFHVIAVPGLHFFIFQHRTQHQTLHVHLAGAVSQPQEKNDPKPLTNLQIYVGGVSIPCGLRASWRGGSSTKAS